jgi:hypothetical protein
MQQFANPGWFWLMVLVPIPLLLDRWRPRIGWPSFAGFGPRTRPGWVWLRWLPPLLRGLAIAALSGARRGSTGRAWRSSWRWIIARA